MAVEECDYAVWGADVLAGAGEMPGRRLSRGRAVER